MAAASSPIPGSGPGGPPCGGPPMCFDPNKKYSEVRQRENSLFVLIYRSYFVSLTLYHIALVMGRMTMKSTCRVLRHMLVRSLVRLHRSLIRLFCTACFAHALRSLTPELMGKRVTSMNWMSQFHIISTHCALVRWGRVSEDARIGEFVWHERSFLPFSTFRCLFATNVITSCLLIRRRI